MNTILKSIATTTVLALSLSAVTATTAFASGNQRKNLTRNANLSRAGIRGAASGNRSVMLQHGDFSSFRSHTKPHADGLLLDLKGRSTGRSAPASMRSRLARQPAAAFFKSASGLSYETEVVARPRSRNR